MRVDVFAQYGKVADSQLSGCVAIVVDVLRASSTIVCAIKNGANQVIPAIDPGEAAAIAYRLGVRDAVLGGERGGVKLPGFHLGNSPLEYTPETVGNKTVIFTTTNGTSAIHSVRNADRVLIGAMINRAAVARVAVDSGLNIVIQCAGTEGKFSADDICAAGAIVDSIAQLSQEPVEFNDLALCSCMIYADYKEGRADLSKTHHYSRLMQLGFQEDLRFCFQEDLTDVVPKYEHGVIIKS